MEFRSKRLITLYKNITLFWSCGPDCFVVQFHRFLSFVEARHAKRLLRYVNIKCTSSPSDQSIPVRTHLVRCPDNNENLSYATVIDLRRIDRETPSSHFAYIVHKYMYLVTEMDAIRTLLNQVRTTGCMKLCIESLVHMGKVSMKIWFGIEKYARV